MELVNARRRPAIVVSGVVLALAVAGVSAWRRAQAGDLPSRPAAFAETVPRRVLWAWEEPEDLRALPTTVGVAYLAETILLGDRVTVLPRRQPLRPAAGASMVTVVRIETRRGFADTPELRTQLTSHLANIGADVGGQGRASALQIDFDATASQRRFYAAVLRSLRPQLPGGLPLSITALVSWCGEGSWMHGLPVDEAVPMFFRMGGPRSLASETAGTHPLREPLCRTSMGLSTDEPWPPQAITLDPAARIYIFAPRPWRPEQIKAVASASLATLVQEFPR